MLQGVQHIIFDLGGVIINLDYKKTEQAFVDAGLTDFPQLYTQLQQTPVFDLFETGKIGRHAFIGALQDLSPIPLTEAQIIYAWNAMLLNFPIRRLQILQQLRLYHDLYLLSNTNEIHEEAFNKTLAKDHGFQSLHPFFDKVYFSHRVGLRKPMPEIFELVLSENNLKAENTLFIDDSPQHIEGAKALGLQTIFLRPGMTIEKDIFKNKNN